MVTLGDPNNQMSVQQIEEKFLRLAARSLDSASAEKLRNSVFEIDRVGAVASILEILK